MTSELAATRVHLIADHCAAVIKTVSTTA